LLQKYGTINNNKVILRYPRVSNGLGSGVLELWSVGVLIKKASILHPLLQHSITPIFQN
jgi:hypothetical protein